MENHSNTNARDHAHDPPHGIPKKEQEKMFNNKGPVAELAMLVSSSMIILIIIYYQLMMILLAINQRIHQI